MLTNVKTWLETTGMEVAEELFLKPPTPPYIVFTSKPDIRGADNKNCIADRFISIELYCESMDEVTEKTIEDLLNEKAIEYTKERTWIQEELLFETVYDFNLIEKF